MFHIAQDDDLVPLITYDKYTLKAEGTGKMNNRILDTTLCDKVFSTNNTDRHEISEILLKVALNTIN
jgi:hypothetical protein